MIRNYLSCYLFVMSTCCCLAPIIAREVIIGVELNELRIAGAFPYPISLQYPVNRHACGGGLIHGKFVLTAARCVIDHNDEFINGHLYVFARATNLHIYVWPVEIVAVRRIFVPKEYNARSHGHDGDIAVIELQEEVEHLSNVNETNWLRLPNNLQQQHENIMNEKTIVTGFGWDEIWPGRRNNLSGMSDGQLRFAWTKISSSQECQQAYPFVHSERHFCAMIKPLRRYDQPFGVCNGDIGGLLVQKDKQQSVTGTVFGVLVKLSIDCDERIKPALYTRVSHYRDFIEHALTGHVTENVRMHVSPH